MNKKKKSMFDLACEYDLQPKKLGNLYRAFCPFHEDVSKPNFTIWEETDSWFCFACNDGGGKAKFLSMIEDISIQEARNRLEGFDIDMEELDDYIEDIGADEEPITVNDELDILLSKIFREFIYKNPDKVSLILSEMQKVDKRLIVPIKPEIVHEIVKETRQRLEKVV